MARLVVRSATAADAASCREVYRPYVEETPLTFETEVPSTSEMADRISAAIATHAWLVLEEDQQVIGYASAKAWDPRDAYRWSCETGIYLSAASQGRGGGRMLYRELLDRLAARGYRVAVGRIVVPNPASTRLHEALGFAPAGVLHSIGWKHGAWLDVALMEKQLGELSSPPPDLSAAD